MRRILQAVSWISLVFLVLPSALFLAGKMDLSQVKVAMPIVTVVWFVVTPLWMGRKNRPVTTGS